MKLRNKIKLIIFLSSFLLLFFVNINISFALDLQVDIPGQEALDFNGTTKPIGQYISNLYNYAISIVGIVATIMLMFGGFTWLTAGGSGEKVGKARDMIFGSLTGLVLALTSYTILTMVNPDLVNFKIQKIQPPEVKFTQPVDPNALGTQNINGCCLSGNINWTGCKNLSKYDCTVAGHSGAVTQFFQNAKCIEDYMSGTTQIWECKATYVSPAAVNVDGCIIVNPGDCM
ncbi:MAG: pilin [Patescibacteria group bacterium]|jgi:hypothetical protein|nr:pilin [Patescibacteria group bacterium]